MQWLRQSTAATVKMGPFLDSTDGNTQETALTISQADIRLSKNGGAFAQTSNVAGATHDELGNYGIPLDTTDTGTLGRLRVHIHEAGALAVWQDFMIVPANVWDSLFGADVLQVDLTQINGAAQTATLDTIKTETAAIKVKTDQLTFTVANQIDANTLSISGSAESANRLERSTLAIVTGTVGTGSTTTSLVASGLSPTSASDDQFNGRIITFDKDTTTAALRGQATDITDYVHATLTFTCTALTSAPVSGDTFTIT